jgi:hypothetical protein
MSFPANWSPEASHRLVTIAHAAVRLAVEQEGTWITLLPRLRAAVRYSSGYAAATAAGMAPTDSFGRSLLLTAPHFEVRVGPGERWRPTGATFYRSTAHQAARVIKDEWGSDLFFEVPAEEAHAVATLILAHPGDGRRQETPL